MFPIFPFLSAYYYFLGEIKLTLQQKHLCNLAMVMYLNVGRLDRYHATLFCAGLQVPDSRKTLVRWLAGNRARLYILMLEASFNCLKNASMIKVHGII